MDRSCNDQIGVGLICTQHGRDANGADQTPQARLVARYSVPEIRPMWVLSVHSHHDRTLRLRSNDRPRDDAKWSACMFCTKKTSLAAVEAEVTEDGMDGGQWMSRTEDCCRSRRRRCHRSRSCGALCRDRSQGVDWPVAMDAMREDLRQM